MINVRFTNFKTVLVFRTLSSYFAFHNCLNLIVLFSRYKFFSQGLIVDLTHFMPLVCFGSPWNHQKTRGFLVIKTVFSWPVKLFHSLEYDNQEFSKKRFLSKSVWIKSPTFQSQSVFLLEFAFTKDILLKNFLAFT